MASSDIAAFLKDSKLTAAEFARRNHIALWLVVASTLLTGLVMRPSEVTVIILGLNVLLVWLAIGLFKRGWTGVGIVVVAEILAATQMIPNRMSALALLANLAMLLSALAAARAANEPHKQR